MTWQAFIYIVFFVASAVLIITTIGKHYSKRKVVVAEKCGHLTRKVGKVTIFGDDYKIRPITRLKDGIVEYCLNCTAQMSIQCAWCGKTILVGDPITLYTPANPNYEPPTENYSVYSENPLTLVGCLPMGYADTGAVWYPPGEVCRVLSPTEQCMMTGDVVIAEHK